MCGLGVAFCPEHLRVQPLDIGARKSRTYGASNLGIMGFPQSDLLARSPRTWGVGGRTDERRTTTDGRWLGAERELKERIENYRRLELPSTPSLNTGCPECGVEGLGVTLLSRTLGCYLGLIPLAGANTCCPECGPVWARGRFLPRTLGGATLEGGRARISDVGGY